MLRMASQLVAVSAGLLLLVGCFGIFKKSDDPTEDGDGPGVDPPVAGWDEPEWCADLADLSDLESGFAGMSLRDTLVGISERRYPPAIGFIDAQSDGELNMWFGGATGSFGAVLDRYEVAVHEGSHIWGFDHFSFDSYSYRVVDDDLIIETAYLDNFPRSEIMTIHPNAATDFYASTYLTGQSGNQGFNTLLDEYNAYAHSLASRYCTRDNLGSGSATSARDGILTFMFYVESYLKLARTNHVSDYDAIISDPAHVDLILTVWDRAEHWLDITASHPELGIDDDEIEGWVYNPNNLDEIERLMDL